MRPSHFKTFAIGLFLLAGCNQNPTASNEAEAKSAANAGAGAIKGGWVENVTATADGGFRIGNPNAKVKLVEYASLTCSHCADFAAKGVTCVKRRNISPAARFRSKSATLCVIRSTLSVRCSAVAAGPSLMPS